jgi:toxin ParE1/3/4
LTVRKRAERDLRDIWNYSVSEWGRDRADRYVDDLLDALDLLCMHPQLGADRLIGRPHFRIWSVGSHIVYYRARRRVEVVRILHAAMDPTRHLS